MSRFLPLGSVAAAAAFLSCAGIAFSAPAEAPKAGGGIPDFSQGNTASWVTVGADWLPAKSGPSWVGFDPKYPHIGNNDPQGRGATPRIGDATSPILQPWAAAQVKKANEEVLAGKTGFQAMSTCWPGGVPGIMLFTAEPVYFVQTPKEVTLLYQRGPNQRHIYLNAEHSKNPKPDWYGESVGHYEGNTLVVDTIGFNDKTFVDSYRTPHTDKLHVVERFRLIDGGNTLEVAFTVDDPGAFYKPWSGTRNRHKVVNPDNRLIAEPDCSEANDDYFNIGLEPVPTAPKAEF